MGDTSQATMENLRLAIHGITAPFSCEGAFTPDKPVKLVFDDGTSFKIDRAENAYAQKELLKPLLDRCKPAPFGDGKRTRFDRNVRDALQLKAEDGKFSVKNLDLESAGILGSIQRRLVPHDPDPVSAELYTVNVYSQGGHFAPHKDTPRGGDMIGTLVVCLPSQFSHGALVLSHRGVVQKIDWASAIREQKNAHQLHWAAFFGDVDHQIKSVWGGARVTLTYLLRRGVLGAVSRPAKSENLAPRVQEAWLALLGDKRFLPKGGILGYPCCHLYHQDARFQAKQRPISGTSSTMLKGRDHLVAASALQAGLEVTFNPYMFENCADGTWQLDRFPTSGEQKKLRWQMDDDDLEKILPIRAKSDEGYDYDVTWIDTPPGSEKMTWRSAHDDAGDTELPAAARLHSCDYCPWGYFGNESSEVDLYTFAALHIEIPPFGKCPRAANKLALAPVKRKPVRRKPKEKT